MAVVALGVAAPVAHAAGGVSIPGAAQAPSRQELNAAARAAIAIADGTRAARAARARGGVTAYSAPVEGTQWTVRYFRAGTPVLEVDVDLAARRTLAVWTGAHVDFPLTRGYPGWFGSHVTAPYIWLPLCLLFVAPFFERRRPLRMAHLDLLAVLAFGVSQWFFQRGQIEASVPLAYVPLVYLLVRMAMRLRNRAVRDPLVSNFGPRLLAVALVVVCAFRIGLNIADRNHHDYVGYGRVGSMVVDVGLSGVEGADRIRHGLELYVPGARLDTYGPLNYVAYVPFETVWPYRGRWDRLPAAHAASIAFDLLTIAGLLVLGMRLRPGRRGRELGLALGFAWAACPYTAYVLNANTNDALVALALVWALVAFRAAFLRGALVGIGAGAKLVPAALLPALLRVGRERSVRPAILCAGGFALVIALAALAFIPPEGVTLIWRHTVARQAGWESPLSIWGLHPSLDWLRTVLQLALAAGAVAVAARRSPTVAQAAAAGAALIIGVELTALHWIYFYIVWFLPLVLIALFVSDLDSPR
jgi:hypothetical protein